MVKKQIDCLAFLQQKTPLKAGVYLAVGQDAYLQRVVQQQFLKQIDDSQLTVNAAKYDLTTTPLATLVNDAMSAPFFGELRVVIGTNADFLRAKPHVKLKQDVGDFLKYLAHPVPTSLVLLQVNCEKIDERKKVTKQLRKTAVVIDCNFPKEVTVCQVVQQQLAKRNVTIEPQALELLLRRTNATLQAVMNELPKLTLAAADMGNITVELVSQLVAVSAEENVFELVTLVLNRKSAKAIALFKTLLSQQEEPTKLVMLLIGQFRLLLQTKILKQRGYMQGAITQTLKIHPYRVKLAMQACQRFSFVELTQAFLGLAELEEKLKSTQQDPVLLFSMFAVKFSN